MDIRLVWTIQTQLLKDKGILHLYFSSLEIATDMFIFSTHLAQSNDEPYDKDLVSKHELTQDAALQKLYGEYEKGKVKKRKMLNFCLTLGHKIMPSVAIWFVISYWMAGMFEYNMIDFSLNVTCEVIFTVLYFTSLISINYWVAFQKAKTL